MSSEKSLLKEYAPKVVGAGLNGLSYVAPSYAAEKALDIFCTPRAGRVKDHHKPFLDLFDQRIVKASDHSIMTYHKPNTGDRILLCHGWESNSFRWRKLYTYLDDHNYDIVMLDAPSHGQSSGNRFNALLYSQFITKVIDEYDPKYICGHSVGGMATIFALDRNIANVEKAIILAAPDSLEGITNSYFKIIGGGDRLRSYYEKVIHKRFHHPTSHFEAARFASNIDIPALIIHDSEDDINQYSDSVSIQNSWKDSELVTTSGLGHSLQDTMVFERIIDFLQADS